VLHHLQWPSSTTALLHLSHPHIDGRRVYATRSRPLLTYCVPRRVPQSAPPAALRRAQDCKEPKRSPTDKLCQVIVSLSNVQKGLAHVQNGLNDLMTAYIKHTASVLAGEDGTLESLQLPSDIAETANNAMAAATFAINNVAHAVAPGAKETATGKNNKRKREKKEKDPNAPKRPLTAAFLFIQAARPVVKKDLEAELAPGQKLEPNAVNIEVNKRWNEMAEPDKEVSHPIVTV